jgi:uncharacterized RDD family membrane protein YckC
LQSVPPSDFTAFPPPPGMAPPSPPVAYTPVPYEPQPYIAIPYAGFWIRVVAYVIDSVILGVIGFVLGFVFAILALISNPNALADSQSTPVNLLSNVVDLLISFGYFAGLWTLNGGTYGQRWLGLRVVDAGTFEPVRPAQAAIRWIGMVLSFLALFLGVIWVAFDGRKQGWMDKLAGTVVVRAVA